MKTLSPDPMDTFTEGPITVLAAIFMRPDAVHIGRASWRPVGKVGHEIAVCWPVVCTNRGAALGEAKTRVEALREAGYEMFGKKSEAGA